MATLKEYVDRLKTLAPMAVGEVPFWGFSPPESTTPSRSSARFPDYYTRAGRGTLPYIEGLGSIQGEDPTIPAMEEPRPAGPLPAYYPMAESRAAETNRAINQETVIRNAENRALWNKYATAPNEMIVLRNPAYAGSLKTSYGLTPAEQYRRNLETMAANAIGDNTEFGRKATKNKQAQEALGVAMATANAPVRAAQVRAAGEIATKQQEAEAKAEEEARRLAIKQQLDGYDESIKRVANSSVGEFRTFITGMKDVLNKEQNGMGDFIIEGLSSKENPLYSEFLAAIAEEEYNLRNATQGTASLATTSKEYKMKVFAKVLGKVLQNRKPK